MHFHSRTLIFATLALILLSTTAIAVQSSPLGACAHRGDVKAAPENTVPAIVSAVKKGAHMIEFDIAITKDDQLVIMHDATVDRTTNGKGKVADLTFAEIRALDAGSWFAKEFAGTKVPTPEEVLSAIPEPILCNVHLKGGTKAAELTATIIERMNKTAQCVLACDSASAAAAKAIAPDLRICNMDRQTPDHLGYAQATVDCRAQFIQLLGKEDGLKPAIDLCHANDITVNYFGAEDPDKIRRLAKIGVNYILTDDLDTCLAVLNEEFGAPPVKLP